MCADFNNASSSKFHRVSPIPPTMGTVVLLFVPSLSANSPGEIPEGLSRPWKGSRFTSLVISGAYWGGSSSHCMVGGSESRTHPRSTDTNRGISFFRVVARRPCCSMFPQFPSFLLEYFIWFLSLLCEQLVLIIPRQLVVGLLPSLHMAARFGSSRHIGLDILFT